MRQPSAIPETFSGATIVVEGGADTAVRPVSDQTRFIRAASDDLHRLSGHIADLLIEIRNEAAPTLTLAHAIRVLNDLAWECRYGFPHRALSAPGVPRSYSAAEEALKQAEIVAERSLQRLAAITPADDCTTRGALVAIAVELQPLVQLLDHAACGLTAVCS
jgi:hypothetical protein